MCLHFIYNWSQVLKFWLMQYYSSVYWNHALFSECDQSIMVYLIPSFIWSLQLSNFSSMEGVLYCKPHFEQLFKETGNFNKSFQSRWGSYWNCSDSHCLHFVIFHWSSSLNYVCLHFDSATVSREINSWTGNFDVAVTIHSFFFFCWKYKLSDHVLLWFIGEHIFILRRGPQVKLLACFQERKKNAATCGKTAYPLEKVCWWSE